MGTSKATIVGSQAEPFFGEDFESLCGRCLRLGAGYFFCF
jgi:hypothetical protein